MYAHSSFIRDKPELLSQLRKSTSASRRRASRVGSDASDSSASIGSGSPVYHPMSPSSPKYRTTYFQPIAQKGQAVSEFASSPQSVTQAWLAFKPQPMMLPKQPKVLQPRKEGTGTGRLDLLALAIERESCLIGA